MASEAVSLQDDESRYEEHSLVNCFFFSKTKQYFRIIIISKLCENVAKITNKRGITIFYI